MSPRYIWRAIEDEDGASNELENISRKMASELRCVAESDDKVVQCLRGRPLAEILDFLNKVWKLQLSKRHQSGLGPHG